MEFWEVFTPVVPPDGAVTGLFSIGGAGAITGGTANAGGLTVTGRAGFSSAGGAGGASPSPGCVSVRTGPPATVEFVATFGAGAVANGEVLPGAAGAELDDRGPPEGGGKASAGGRLGRSMDGGAMSGSFTAGGVAAGGRVAAFAGSAEGVTGFGIGGTITGLGVAATGGWSIGGAGRDVVSAGGVVSVTLDVFERVGDEP